jgi:hypothetical protein
MPKIEKTVITIDHRKQGFCILTLAFATCVFSCSQAVDFTPKSALKPGQIIQFIKPQFACATKEKYDEAALYSYGREKTKFKAMFSNRDCVAIAADINVKVLSVIEHYMDFDIIEITYANFQLTPTGYFTEWDYAK